MKDHKAKTGGRWVADEMQVDVGGKKVWLWNVMDAETRYILASHLTSAEVHSGVPLRLASTKKC